MSFSDLKKELSNFSNKEKSLILLRFFKTKKGEYGYGDKFIGVVVPIQRKIAKKYKDLSLDDCQILLKSKIHEFRLTTLFILINKFEKGSLADKKRIFDLYIKNTKYINNWDLVDLSAPNIVGNFLFKKSKKILYKFSKSKSLWERRISILATFYFIKNGEFDDCLKLSSILLNDEEDLINKAVGWMLREVGKRNLGVLIDFLNKNKNKMNRTTLRYSVERFHQSERQKYLSKL